MKKSPSNYPNNPIQNYRGNGIYDYFLLFEQTCRYKSCPCSPDERPESRGGPKIEKFDFCNYRDKMVPKRKKGLRP
jgi:hypothetical protein